MVISAQGRALKNAFTRNNGGRRYRLRVNPITPKKGLNEEPIIV